MKAGSEMDIIHKFISEVQLKFAFLEEYGYMAICGEVEKPDYYPDSEVVVKYIGEIVMVKVYWYFAGANMGVTFVELNNSEISPINFNYSDLKNACRAINLYTLAGYLKKLDNRLFLLEDVDNVAFSKIKKREKVINESMPEIIDGLATAVRKLAVDIIKGDTTIFKDVMSYHSQQKAGL